MVSPAVPSPPPLSAGQHHAVRAARRLTANPPPFRDQFLVPPDFRALPVPLRDPPGRSFGRPAARARPARSHPGGSGHRGCSRSPWVLPAPGGRARSPRVQWEPPRPLQAPVRHCSSAASAATGSSHLPAGPRCRSRPGGPSGSCGEAAAGRRARRRGPSRAPRPPGAARSREPPPRLPRERCLRHSRVQPASLLGDRGETGGEK